MVLREYYCENCQIKFEEINSSGAPESPNCPKCKGKSTKKLISKFAVGGRGDLRESTMHGCHDPAHDHSSHPHSDSSED